MMKNIANIAHVANFVFTGGTGKPWSNIADIANIPNTGTVNPTAGA